jgi:hypothetical protein
MSDLMKSVDAAFPLITVDGELKCFCPSCQSKFIQSGDELNKCLNDEVELEGGICHPVEEFEEMRLVLGSFLRKDLLDEILALYKELSKEPRQPEMYAWFVRNSQFGGECKYALQALRKFKEERLDRFELLLNNCLQAISKIREDNK